MYFFGDNHEAAMDKSSHNVFYYGGYLISKESLKLLEDNFNEIKDNYSIPHHFPLKFNLKDNALKKFYENNNSYKLLQNIIDCVEGDIREDILKNLLSFEIMILFSGHRELRTRTEKKELLKWSFTNILQRISYEKTDDKIINMILDRDEENYNLFCETYLYPYYFEKGICNEKFKCKNICKNIPFITFSATIFNPFLQIADIIVGACGAFLKYAFKNRDKQNAYKYFKPIIPLIRGFNNIFPEQLFRRGLIIKPDQDRELAKDKFIKLI